MKRIPLRNSEHEVDHRNGNKLDNRKSNLRICSRSENQMNRGKQKNNTSGFKGVSQIKMNQKWVAYIKVNYKRIYIGCFLKKVDAARAYNMAALKYHGEFGLLNKV